MKLLKFELPACAPCRTMSGQLNTLNVAHEAIDASVREDLVKQYGVVAVPTLIKIDDDGNEAARLRGSHSLNKLKQFIGA